MLLQNLIELQIIVKNNIQFIMTSDECLTGTDRLCKVSKLVEADYYINIQGDEPLFNPNDIKGFNSRAK